MSVWQFDLAFAQGGAAASWLPSSRADVMHYLASRVGPSTPMLEGWRYFGNEAGNCIDMVSDPDGRYELHARLDACAEETDHFIEVLAKGKNAHDKRDTVAERDWQRDKARLMRDKG